MSPNIPDKEWKRQRWEERRRRRAARMNGPGRFVLGIFILLLGVLFLLQNLGYFYVDRIWQFWPVLLIALGVSHLLSGAGTGRRLWGAAMAAAGGLFLANTLGYLPWDIWRVLWPLWLIFWGLLILFRGRRGGWSAPFGPDGDSTTANVLNEVAVFGGVHRRVESQEFEGGEISAVFGGVEIDLRDAATKKDEIFLDANAVFGSIELRVPETWAVTVRGAGILGGYEDRTHPAPVPDGAQRHHLIIRGSAVFGGVEVKN